MSKVEELIAETKLNDLLHKQDTDKGKEVVLWLFAVIGALAVVAGIAYAVYRFFESDYMEDYDEDEEEDKEEDKVSDDAGEKDEA